MSGAHEFVDESKPPGRYILAVTAVESAAISTVRQQLVSWRHRGSSSIHFAKEKDSFRRTVLTQMVGLPVIARLYVVDGRAREAEARRVAIGRLADDLLVRGSARLVLERDDSMARGDRHQLSRAFRGAAAPPIYTHLRAREEPMLWISDAVAWCHQRGGEWPTLCSPIVADVIPIRLPK